MTKGIKTKVVKEKVVKDSKPKTFFEWLDGLLGVRNGLGSK